MEPTQSHHDIADEYPPESMQRYVLVVAILGAAVVFVDSSVANIALPAIQRDLGLTTAQQQWAASAYLLTLSVLLLPGGRLSDLFGRKRIFMIGLAAFSACALLAATAPNGTVLIAARALEGIAGAVLAPTTLALLNATYPPDRRGAAIGMWSGWSGIATLLGPVIAGVMIDRASWRFAFVISPVVALVTLAMATRIPESRSDHPAKGFDFAGVGLLVASLGAIVFALIQAPIAGWSSPTVIGLLVGGMVLLPVFVWWESRAHDPLLPFGMFEDRNLAVANGVTFFVYAALYGMSFYVGLYLQTALGASALLASVIFIPTTIILFVLSPIAGRLNDRVGPKWLLVFGPLTAGLGLVIMSFVGSMQQLWTVGLPGIIVFACGMGFSVAPVTTTAIGAAPLRYTGAASGFNNAVSRIAGLLAIAVLGVVIIGLWHAGLDAAAADAPANVRAAIETVQSKTFNTPKTTGLTAAEKADVAARTLAASRIAFRRGLWVAAGLMVLGALTSLAFMRPATVLSDDAASNAPPAGD